MDVLPDEGIEFLYSCSADDRKEAILDIVIVAFANHENLLPFCNAVEALIDNSSMKHVVEEIRHGKNEIYVFGWIYEPPCCGPWDLHSVVVECVFSKEVNVCFK